MRHGLTVSVKQGPRFYNKDNTASTVWADTAYRSKRNERHLARRGYSQSCQRPPNFPRLWPSKIPWLDGFGRCAVISRRDDRSSPFLAAGHDV